VCIKNESVVVLFENCISETAIGISKIFNNDSALNLWEEFNFVPYRSPLWSSGQSSWLTTEMYCASCEVRTEFIYIM
jgi:hypothetical protein